MTFADFNSLKSQLSDNTFRYDVTEGMTNYHNETTTDYKLQLTTTDYNGPQLTTTDLNVATMHGQLGSRSLQNTENEANLASYHIRSMLQSLQNVP